LSKKEKMDTKWTIDGMHIEIGFKVRHMMISNVSGNFGQFTAEASTNGDDFSTANFFSDHVLHVTNLICRH
jgi:polyisoprenoid-binding protein YceI